MNGHDRKASEEFGKSGVGESTPGLERSGPDLSDIKRTMKATWMDGDYAEFCTYMEPGARTLLRSWNIRPRERFLDVGCGAGQLVIPAAEAGVEATGVDIASNLIDYARTCASREGVNARFDEGDAEDLPYPDASFDVVVSLIGAMFAPRPDKVASELARVCRPGGRLIMANWTPTGMVGKMFQVVRKYAPPPAGIVSPLLWGDQTIVQERLGRYFPDLTLVLKYYPNWTYPFSEAELVDFFRRLFGPIKGAFAKLEPSDQEAFKEELIAVYSAHNLATDGTLNLQAELLEIQGIRS